MATPGDPSPTITPVPGSTAGGKTACWGISDRSCRLCFSLALWNGVDPILKERPFGLSNPEGNHGEDVKDDCFHLAASPTHSFLRGLYKYPQATSTDLLIRIRAVSRGPQAAPLTLLPTLWLRNTWDRGYPDEGPQSLGVYELLCEQSGAWIFTDNATNRQRLWGQANSTPFQKDGFHRFLIEAEAGAINPAGCGSKAACLLQRRLAPSEAGRPRPRSEPPSARCSPSGSRNGTGSCASARRLASTRRPG